MRRKKNASVLIVTLLIMSLVTIFTQQLVRSVFVGSYFVRRMVAREQAEMIALGGIHVAMAQLFVPQEKKGKPQDTKTDKSDASGKEESGKHFLSRILPHLNRWQVFELTENSDGIDGTLKVCISCEEGKIPLNESFDFKKGEFKKEVAELLKGVVVPKVLPQGLFLKKLTEYLRKRKKPLEDLSELLDVQGINSLDFFYQPPVQPQGRAQAQPNTKIALQDLFTVWGSEKLEPLFFSDSVCALMGFRRPLANDTERIKEKFKKITEEFKPDWGREWEKNWSFLQIIYNQKPKNLKELVPFFSQEFKPKIYSVLSSGSVDEVTQTVLAIIEKRDEDGKAHSGSEDAKENVDKKERNVFESPYIIRRIYWV